MIQLNVHCAIATSLRNMTFCYVHFIENYTKKNNKTQK